MIYHDFACTAAGTDTDTDTGTDTGTTGGKLALKASLSHINNNSTNAESTNDLYGMINDEKLLQHHRLS